MAYTVWVDADGYATAELQITVETAAQAAREARELRAMDCGKIVVQAHGTMNEADHFASYVEAHEKPAKIATMYKRFQKVTAE